MENKHFGAIICFTLTGIRRWQWRGVIGLMLAIMAPLQDRSNDWIQPPLFLSARPTTTNTCTAARGRRAQGHPAYQPAQQKLTRVTQSVAETIKLS